MTLLNKRLVTTVSVNMGSWRNYGANDDVDRIDGWRPCYFQEAPFNFGWLPKNCYGKFAIEMKESDEKETNIEVVVGWQESIRDGGVGKFNIIEESKLVLGKYEPERQKRWEIYETDYFKLPDYDGVILLWLLQRNSVPTTTLSIAMWTLAIFEDDPNG
jgi:hypothetical protein